MRIKTLLLSLTALCAASAQALAGTSVTALRTESLETPIGIDEAHPLLSWQMASDRIGALQTGYRIMMALSESQLASGDLVYDSGMVLSDKSIGIEYAGPALKGSTRYFWKVEVTDETRTVIQSPVTWFETGLMEQGWSQAQWIGSDEVLLSKYRTFFDIDYNVTVPKGSNRAVFVYSVKDNDNWIAADLSLEGAEGPELIVRYSVEGDVREQCRVSLADIIPHSAHHSAHAVKLRVSTPGYHLKSNLEVFVDGTALKLVEPVEQPQIPGMPAMPARPQNLTQTVIDPYPNGERVHDWARLHSIGFMQPRGQRAVFSDIVISERNWNTVLYKDPQQSHDVVGDGRIHCWEPYGLVSAPMLRKSATFDRKISSARLYVTARGIYEFYVNGQRVSNDYFNPAWTDFRYRIMYNSYDITPLMRQGANGFGAMLGAGWYSDLNIFTSDYVDPYGIRQSLMAKIVVTFEDGTSQTIVTDSSWKRYDLGPVTRNGFQFGEDYDARKEVDGWTGGSFDDSSWKSAVIFDRPGPATEIQAFVGLPIQNNITLTALSVTEPVKGTYVYDLGQNIVGVPRLEGMRGKSGQLITLRYGEMVYPETIPTDPVAPYTIETYQKMKGQVYIENYRGAISIDNYIFRGASSETYQPLFTCHGFRYISITGLDAPLPIEQVKGIVLESIGNATSMYTSSNENVNKLFQNIQWGQRGNFQAVPTDCPQRDERQGWTGDAQVFGRAATYFSPYVDQFYARWLYSVRDNQNSDGSYFNYFPVTGKPPYGYPKDSAAGWMGWMEAGIIIPWHMYQQYGDVRTLERHYDSMTRYMDYLERRAENYLQPSQGIGDHLAIQSTNIGLTNTAYYAYDAYMMSHIAAALGKTADQRKYQTLYDNIKVAFNKAYVNDKGVTVAPYAPMFRRPGAVQAPDAPKPGDIVPVDTQTSYAVPLQADLFDDEHKAMAVENFVESIHRNGDKLTTGFIGTPYLNLALSENGHDDLAYVLFENDEYPSWLYPVLQGATTMWERWNSYTIENGFGPVDMNSFNHYAYGAIGEWMFSHSLGIQVDVNRPGYKHIILQPKVGGQMSHAEGYFESPYGRISSGWEKVQGGYRYKVTVPANTTASLNLQASGISKVSVISGSQGVGPMRSLEGRVMAELQSGTYEFEVRY